LGHPSKAEALFTKALAIRQARLGPDDPLTLRSTSLQAAAYQHAGKLEEAIKQFKKGGDDKMRILRAENLESPAALNDRGADYVLGGKFVQAIPLLEQAREGRIKQLGEEHEDTLATLYHLSVAYLSGRRYTEAIALSEKVLAARVKRYGEGHALSL